MALKYSILRIHTNFKTIKNVIGRMEKRPPNFLTYLFGVTPPIRCYPLLRTCCHTQELPLVTYCHTQELSLVTCCHTQELSLRPQQDQLQRTRVCEVLFRLLPACTNFIGVQENVGFLALQHSGKVTSVPVHSNNERWL